MIAPAISFGIPSFVSAAYSSSNRLNSCIRGRNTLCAHMEDRINSDYNKVPTCSSNAENKLLQLTQSHFAAQALFGFVQLGIPDVLDASHAMTVDEIVSRLKPTNIVRHDVLFRCLRLLCTVGVIQEGAKVVGRTSQSTFSLTDMGELLRTSDSEGMIPFVMHWMEDPLWNAWSQLPNYLTGNEDARPPFDTANGMSASEYYANNLNSQRHRNAVARYASSKEITSILDAICSDNSYLNETTLSGKTIVDIGGGYGDLLFETKRSIPTIGTCYCIDLPDVIQKAISANNNKDGTVNLVAGDMFDYKTIPECDVIFAKHVLCDFSDLDVVRALQSFHKMLSPSGKLVIMDAVLPNGDDLNGKWNPAVSFDVLLMLSGRRGERSRLEWSNLACEAGFVLDEVVSTSSVTVDLAIFSKITPA